MSDRSGVDCDDGGIVQSPETGLPRVREKARLKILGRFALEIIRISSEKELFWYVAREVVGKLGFLDCVIYLTDSERKLLRQVAAIGEKNPIAETIVNILEIPIGDGITGQVAKSREAIIIDDLSSDSRYIPDLVAARSEICVPLIVGDELVGVIDSEDPRPHRFGGEDLEVLNTVAAMTSAKLNLLRKDEALRESERRFWNLFETAASGIGRTFLEDGRVILANRKLAEIFGFASSEELIAEFVFSDHYVNPDDRRRLMANCEQSPGTPIECAFTKKDGSTVTVQAQARANYEAGILDFVIIDITALKKAEETLKAREAHLIQAHLMAKLGVFVWDNVIDKAIYFSDGLAALLGMTEDQMRKWGDSHENTLEQVVPEDRARYHKVIRHSENNIAPYDVEYRVRDALGNLRHWREMGDAIADDDGRLIRTIGTIQDITDHKIAEEQLHQMQKMEAVGQLTGGVAHDFNNLLTIILGNAELLTRTEDEDRELADAVIRAALRGAELTQRLLAFSRKQPLRPRSIGLAGIVGSMSELLQRTLGETVELVTFTGSGLWPATADAGQVENAILNLAINARDAMADGGKLTIECANARLDDDYVAHNPEVAAGDYVAISVSDTGIGMSDAIIEHALEPFFTTKEIGNGTGLGLSMVYGFAKQSGGHVKLYSEVGKGTTVKLYLPRTEVGIEPADSTEASRELRGQGEVVLVVEDDTDVRTLTVTMLDSLGYQVIDAPDARAALVVLESGERVDLLLSDVVLPGGMGGPDLVRHARERALTLRAIFMSGYAAEAANRNGFVGGGATLLSKPFERRQLATALREALD